MRTGLLLLAVLVCFGLGPIFEKLSLREASPVGLLTLRSVMISAALLFLVLAVGRTQELLHLSLTTYLWIAASALFGGLLGLGLYFVALKQGLASRIAALTGAYPLVTALFAVLFLGEPYTLQRLIGTVLVIAGLMLVW